jgi:O-antigen/teichoic acid export membrane protein
MNQQQPTTRPSFWAHLPWESVAASAATIVAITANTLAGIVVARQLDAQNYGYVAYFFAMYGLVLVVGSLGLTGRVIMLAAEPGPPTSGQSVETLLRLRLITILPLAFLALGAALFHQMGGGIAYLVGGVYLLRGFLTGILAGKGRVLAASLIDCLQGLIYGALVLLDTNIRVETVYGGQLVSHLVAAAITIVVLISLKLIDLRQLLLWQGAALTLLRSLASMYTLTLLLGVFGPLSTFLLGTTGHLDEAGLFGIGMGLFGLVVMVCATIMTNVYYPHLCQLLNAEQQPAALAWLDTFVRGFLLIGVVVAAPLSFAAGSLIEGLYTARYLGATLATQLLSWANLIYLLQQLIAWTLVAAGRYNRPLFPAALQCTTLLIGGLLASITPAPLEASISVYCGAVLLGAALTVRDVGQELGYNLLTLRNGLAILVTLGSAGAFYSLLPPITGLVPVLITFAISAAICGLVGGALLFGNESRQVWNALRSGRRSMLREGGARD